MQTTYFGPKDFSLVRMRVDLCSFIVDLQWPPAALSIDTQSRRFFAFRSIGDSSDQVEMMI